MPYEGGGLCHIMPLAYFSRAPRFFTSVGHANAVFVSIGEGDGEKNRNSDDPADLAAFVCNTKQAFSFDCSREGPS